MTVTSNVTTTSTTRELVITTDKYVYTIKYVGHVDNNSPYNGWLTCDITVGAITPNRRYTRVKTIIRGDVRIHPEHGDGRSLNALALNQTLLSFILGYYTTLMDKNKKLTQGLLDDVVSDYIAAVHNDDAPLIKASVSLRSKSKSTKPLEMDIVITRGYTLRSDGVYRYDNTCIEAALDGHCTFSMMADDEAAPLSTEGLTAVIMAAIHKLTVKLEAFTGLNHKVS